MNLTQIHPNSISVGSFVDWPVSKAQQRTTAYRLPTSALVSKSARKVAPFVRLFRFLRVLLHLRKCRALASSGFSQVRVVFSNSSATEGMLRDFQLRLDGTTGDVSAKVILLTQDSDYEWPSVCDAFQIVNITPSIVRRNLD
jgi:hypothetical protein